MFQTLSKGRIISNQHWLHRFLCSQLLKNHFTHLHFLCTSKATPDISDAFVLTWQSSSSCWEGAATTLCDVTFLLTVIIRCCFRGRCFSEISIDMLTGLCPSLILLHHRVKSGYPVRKKCVRMAVMVWVVLVCSLQATIPDNGSIVAQLQIAPCALFQKWNVQLNVSTTQQRCSVPHLPCQMWRVVSVE